MSVRRLSDEKPDPAASRTEPQDTFQHIYEQYPFIADGLRTLLSKGRAALNVLWNGSDSTVSLHTHEKAWQTVERQLGFVNVTTNLAGRRAPRIVIHLCEQYHTSVSAMLTTIPEQEMLSDDAVDPPSLKKSPYPPEHVNVFQSGKAAIGRLFALAALLENPSEWKKQKDIAQVSNLDSTSISKFMITMEEWEYVKAKNLEKSTGEVKIIRITGEGIKFGQLIMRAFGSQRIAEFEES